MESPHLQIPGWFSSICPQLSDVSFYVVDLAANYGVVLFPNHSADRLSLATHALLSVQLFEPN